MSPVCGACGRPDALGLGLCAECGRGVAGDTLVFVRRTSSLGDRRAIAQRLEALLGGRVDTPDGRQAARGGIALIRVPAAIADAVCDSLERHGVAARSVGAGRAFLAMPSHFFLMITAMATIGTLAGMATGSAGLALASPAMAAALLVVSHVSLQRPWLRPPEGEVLPEQVEAALLGAFARLGAGRTRELLADLVSLARPLAGRLRSDGDPGALEATIAELVIAACATALEVERLEVSAAVVRDELQAGDDVVLRSAAERCGSAATAGTRRLVEAVAAVADAGGRTALLDGSATRRLADLLDDLRGEAGRREHALREIDRLLAR